MNKVTKRVLNAIIRHPVGWRLIDATVGRFVEYANWIRCNGYEQYQARSLFFENAVQVISPQLRVLHGPFSGMIYPEMKSYGSSLVPKLLGCYERELHAVIEQLCTRPYNVIVDIGCAEGYYAVGFARRIESAAVYAYDTNPNALSACRAMAQINNVDDRVFIGECCDSSTLLSLPLGLRALIVSDCEGYEKSLFTEEIAKSLSQHDLLIEIHDNIDIDVSVTLQHSFRKTHKCTVIQSTDDIFKPRLYEYKELESFGLKERLQLLTERRDHVMEWFLLESLM